MPSTGSQRPPRFAVLIPIDPVVGILYEAQPFGRKLFRGVGEVAPDRRQRRDPLVGIERLDGDTEVVADVSQCLEGDLPGNEVAPWDAALAATGVEVGEPWTAIADSGSDVVFLVHHVKRVEVDFDVGKFDRVDETIGIRGGVEIVRL